MTPEQLSTAIVDVLTTLVGEGEISLPDGVPRTEAQLRKIEQACIAAWGEDTSQCIAAEFLSPEQ